MKANRPVNHSGLKTMTAAHLLAIDQGTTSTRAILFDHSSSIVQTAQQEFSQYFPGDGWVEHDPEEIWTSTVSVCRSILTNHRDTSIAAIGITNQRETTVVWDRKTGRAIHNAIVWQDRRTAAQCEALRQAGHEKRVTELTGLLLDPYFSATKLAWILNHVDGARARAERGELAFGTTDCFLLWRLTGGDVHATDATNASRTMLYDIHQGQWSGELLELFDIPRGMLPEVRNSADDFGVSREECIGRTLNISGIAGDQQAAAIGQTCIQPGMVKSTYGTGCFVLLNTGDNVVVSKNRLLSTVAYQLDGKRTYALEGSIFVAGAAVQWLRDGLGVIHSADVTEDLARNLNSNDGVYLVPAFTGLGAPHWDPDARGAIVGLTRDTGVAHLVRAALESVCYQTHDLLTAMTADGASMPNALRVDGGMANNDWLMQFLADMLEVHVEVPTIPETTALGAAYLAGVQAGIYESLDSLAGYWQCAKRFVPQANRADRQQWLTQWSRAVEGVLTRNATSGL
jgi:glycerol kinase